MESIDFTTLDWLQAIVWTLIGIAFYKAWIYPHGTTKFSLKKWFNENFVDVIRGILFTLISVKLGDIIFQLVSFLGLDLKGLSEAIKKAGLDPVQTALILSIIVQHILYKRRKKNKERARTNSTVNPDPPNPPPGDK